MLKQLGNILWFLFGGAVLALLWFLVGVLLCITLIGIPFGIQCFKIARLVLFPFGKFVRYDTVSRHLLLNALWILLFGWELSVTAVIAGCFWCITIVGIPVGLQSFKFAKLAFFPFGAHIR